MQQIQKPVKSKEQLQAERRQRMAAPIKLHEYDPKYPQMFQHYKNILEEIFKDSLDYENTPIKGIQHIGSSAIVGMPGTFFIDLAFSVKQWPIPQSIIDTLEKQGFEDLGSSHLKGDHWFQRRNEKEDFEELGECVVFHVFNEEGWENLKQLVAYRDYLNFNQEAKQKYIDVKRQQENSQKNFVEYKMNKAKVVKELEGESRQWAIDNNIFEKYNK